MHRALAQLLIVWVVVVVVLTPRAPIPATREPHRAALRMTWAVAGAAAAVGATLALREQRRSIRRQYALSTVACIAALAVGLLGYPVKGSESAPHAPAQPSH